MADDHDARAHAEEAQLALRSVMKLHPELRLALGDLVRGIQMEQALALCADPRCYEIIVAWNGGVLSPMSRDVCGNAKFDEFRLWCANCPLDLLGKCRFVVVFACGAGVNDASPAHLLICQGDARSPPSVHTLRAPPNRP